jgi:hypothetical protein
MLESALLRPFSHLFNDNAYLMTNFIKQTLVTGGQLLMIAVWLVVSQVLLLLFVGVTLVICVGQVCYLAIVDKDYRNNLYEYVSGKRKH